MFGYKVRVYYKDIPRVCTNCYVTGHQRKECENQTKSWIHHVVDFITDNEDIQEQDLGYWMKKSQKHVQDNPDIFNGPDDLSVDDLNIDSDSEFDSDAQDKTVTNHSTEASSPNVITANQIKSVSNVVNTIKTQDKSKKTKKNPNLQGRKQKDGVDPQKHKNDVIKHSHMEHLPRYVPQNPNN